MRFEEDGRLIWEGDLQCPYYNEDDVVLDLGPVWDAIRRARSWIGMERMLTHHNENEDNEETMGPGTIATINFLQRVTITVIAIRDQDEAMVPLGHFVFDNPLSLSLIHISEPTRPY